MATRAEVTRAAEHQQAIAAAAVAAVAAWWQAQELANVGAVAGELADVLVGIVETYDAASASEAAERYDLWRAEAGASGAFEAVPAEGVGPEHIRESVGYALLPLGGDEPNPQKALDRVTTATQRFVRQAGRDTIADNAERDPRGHWVRVPTGDETCAFCLILASRGATPARYSTRESALYRRNGRKYHNDCDCTAVPVWSEADYPEGYDPEELYSRYARARDEVTAPGHPIDLREVTATMREAYGLK